MCFRSKERTGAWLRGTALLAILISVVAGTATASIRINLDGFWRSRTDPSGRVRPRGDPGRCLLERRSSAFRELRI
jgi:hypothetical protein